MNDIPTLVREQSIAKWNERRDKLINKPSPYLKSHAVYYRRYEAHITGGTYLRSIQMASMGEIFFFFLFVARLWKSITLFWEEKKTLRRRIETRSDGDDFGTNVSCCTSILYRSGVQNQTRSLIIVDMFQRPLHSIMVRTIYNNIRLPKYMTTFNIR